MRFKTKTEKPDSTAKWFLLLLIPVINLYGFWKLAKLLGNVESESGD